MRSKVIKSLTQSLKSLKKQKKYNCWESIYTFKKPTKTSQEYCSTTSLYSHFPSLLSSLLITSNFESIPLTSQHVGFTCLWLCQIDSEFRRHSSGPMVNSTYHEAQMFHRRCLRARPWQINQLQQQQDDAWQPYIISTQFEEWNEGQSCSLRQRYP